MGPDALETQDAVGLDRFPLAAMLIAVSFLTIFFLHRILAPALRLTPHLHSLNATTTPVSASGSSTPCCCAHHAVNLLLVFVGWLTCSCVAAYAGVMQGRVKHWVLWRILQCVTCRTAGR